MRIARPFVVVIAFVMAVLAGTEQAALAVNQWVIAKKVPGAGERPEQAWGSARGRGHDASGDATDADAEGGRRGAQKAPGELMPAAGAAPVNLGGEPQAKIPQVKPVEAPKQAAPAGFDPKRSVEQLDKRDQRSRTFRNEDGTYTTQYYDEQVNFFSPGEAGRRSTPPWRAPRAPGR